MSCEDEKNAESVCLKCDRYFSESIFIALLSSSDRFNELTLKLLNVYDRCSTNIRWSFLKCTIDVQWMHVNSLTDERYIYIVTRVSHSSRTELNDQICFCSRAEKDCYLKRRVNNSSSRTSRTEIRYRR
jgi:hypothetical protein